MTVYSMTGYAVASTKGDAQASGSGPQVSVEARSVNGRFLDVALRLPDEFRGLEPALRELLTASFKRGKVELRVSSNQDSGNAWPEPSSDQLGRLAALEQRVLAQLPQARGLSVNEALNWCKGGSVAQGLDDSALAAAKACITGLKEARGREGARLVTMLMGRVAHIRTLAQQAAPLVSAVVQRQQARFLERWHEAVSGANDGAPVANRVPPEALRDRAMSEAAAYAIRIDVAEELSRLASHLDEIERLLNAGGELGKRLDFLIQELQREANTLGSKSAALELTTISVEMKVAIEQMREQVQNIE